MVALLARIIPLLDYCGLVLDSRSIGLDTGLPVKYPRWDLRTLHTLDQLMPHFRIQRMANFVLVRQPYTLIVERPGEWLLRLCHQQRITPRRSCVARISTWRICVHPQEAQISLHNCRFDRIDRWKISQVDRPLLFCVHLCDGPEPGASCSTCRTNSSLFLRLSAIGLYLGQAAQVDPSRHQKTLQLIQWSRWEIKSIGKGPPSIHSRLRSFMLVHRFNRRAWTALFSVLPRFDGWRLRKDRYSPRSVSSLLAYTWPLLWVRTLRTFYQLMPHFRGLGGLWIWLRRLVGQSTDLALSSFDQHRIHPVHRRLDLIYRRRLTSLQLL